MKIRKATLGFAAAALLAVSVCLPTAALASVVPSADAGVDGSAPTEVVSTPMQIDCGTFTEADRARAVSEGLNFCGALDGASGGGATRGQTVSNCGVASIYADRDSGGRLRISYGLHSTQGAIITRSVTATWGPFDTGSNYDFGPVGNASYSNTLTRASIPKGTKVGASLRGTVTVAGWMFSCVASADDPVHAVY